MLYRVALNFLLFYCLIQNKLNGDLRMIQSHNEWDKVEEIIVGTGLYCYAPSLDTGFNLEFTDS